MISIRPARIDDASAIAHVHMDTRRRSLPWLPNLHSDEEARQWMSAVVIPNMAVWIAEADQRIVGYMALDGEMLDQLYILPEYQRRGIGDVLLMIAKRLSPRTLSLYTFQRNENARRFYEQRGFVAIDFNDGSRNEEHEPDVLYRGMPVPSPEG